MLKAINLISNAYEMSNLYFCIIYYEPYPYIVKMATAVTVRTARARCERDWIMPRVTCSVTRRIDELTCYLNLSDPSVVLKFTQTSSGV
jgi:hypothetical protein